MSTVVEKTESSSREAAEISASKARMIGLLTGFAAAVGYTLANIALKQLAKPDNLQWAIWVTANKAVPASLLTWGLVLFNLKKGVTAFPPGRLILPLILTGLAMQFFGNLMFQYSLGLVGLAMAVPITFAMILISGAIFSRIYLGESITQRTFWALTILIIAVSVLSLGAGETAKSILKDASVSQIITGIIAAMICGTGYGACGVVIRKNVKNLPVSATLVLISTTGVVAMGMLSLCISMPQVLATTSVEFGTMFLAGVFNAGAFYSIGVSYRYLNVTQVNLVNTSQIAMATIIGVLFFLEPITAWLIIGVLMTIAGLFMIDRR